MTSIFDKLLNRRIVSVDLDINTRITAVPKLGGVMVTICTGDGTAISLNRVFVSSLSDLTKSFSLTDDQIVKLSKAF